MMGSGPSNRRAGRNRLRSTTPSKRRSTGRGASPGTRDPNCSSTGGTGPSESATRMEMTHFRRKGNRARGSEAADRGERSVYRCAAESTELVICMTAHVEDRMVDENAMGALAASAQLEANVVDGNCKSDLRGYPKPDRFGVSTPRFPVCCAGFPTELAAGHGCPDGKPGCC